MTPPKSDRSPAHRPFLRGFTGNERGTTAVLFALLLVPMLGIVFCGIDYSRAMSIQSQLQTAADAAATSAASRLHEGTAKAEAAFNAAFIANLPDDLKDQPYELSISGNGKKLTVELASVVPTTMVALFGLSKLNIAVAASAERPKPSLLAGTRNSGTVLDALPDDAEGARVRADIERALRSAGIPAPEAPGREDVMEARRQVQEAMRAMGHSGNVAGHGELPDPAELEGMQRMIMRELGRVRF